MKSSSLCADLNELNMKLQGAGKAGVSFQYHYGILKAAHIVSMRLEQPYTNILSST
jgi:hypothetical protein